MLSASPAGREDVPGDASHVVLLDGMLGVMDDPVNAGFYYLIARLVDFSH